MPVTYTSARFVGREAAFAQLAASLDDAAHGRTRTLLLEGTAGIGVTRFLDEAIVRIQALRDPMTVLRATAWPAHADEPYGPIIRAIGPTILDLPDDGLPDLLGPATSEVVRLLPELGPRLTALGVPIDEGGETAPERRQARTLEGILGLLGRLGERHPVVLVLEDLHLADAATRALVTFLARISRDQRLTIIGTHQPDVVARDDSWTSDLEAILTGSRPERLALPPLDRDELAALIEGIEGERASASLLLLVAERSGGLPLVAEELLAARRELPSASLTGSFDELVIARLAVRSQECRRVLRLLALAERPLTWDQLAAVAAAFEVDTSGRAPRSVTGPRVGEGVLDSGPVGRPHRGARQRLPGRARRHHQLPARIDRQGRRLGPAADRADPLSRSPGRESRRAAVGRGGTLARCVRSACGPLGGDRGGRGRGRPACRRGRAGRARARAVAPRGAGAGRRGPASGRGRLGYRRSAGPRLGGRLRGRPDVAGDGLPRSGDRRARRPTRSRPARAPPRAAGARPPRRRRPGRCDARRPARGRAGPARAEPRAGHGRRRPGAAQDARRDLLRRPATGPRGHQGRARL